jgi:hypothetical protein
MSTGDIEYYLLYSSESKSALPFVWVPSITVATYIGHYSGDTIEERVFNFIQSRIQHSRIGNDFSLEEAIASIASSNGYSVSSFTFTHSNTTHQPYEFW